MSDAAAMNDWNTSIIEEFRANAGVVGGPFEGAPMVILHHTGAKSGVVRETPLMAQVVPDGWAIFASKGGAPTAPDWFHNLVANPDCQIELGTETIDATARVLEGDERTQVWEAQKAAWPQFAGYEEATTGIREIPVVVLSRR